MLGWFQDDEENAYTDRTYIQKVLQQLRCASFDGITTLRLSEKTGAFHGDFETVSRVKLIITDKDIVLSRVTHPEKKRVGGQNRSTAWLGEYGDGLSILVQSDDAEDFYAIQDYIFPSEDESSLSDVNEFLTSIKDKDALEASDIEKLRSIANCGSENLTVAYRYELIKKIESLNPVSLTPIYEDLILDLIENHREDVALDEYANEWLDLLASDRVFLKKLFYGIDEYQWWSGSEANQTRFMQAIQALWQISNYNNKQNSAYTYDQYSLNSNGNIEVESPYTLVYGGTKLFPRVEYNPVVTSSDVRFNFEIYTYEGTKRGHFDYHPFQPIHLVKEDQGGISYLQYDMPAIALVPLMEADNFDRGIERAGLTADIVLTATGVGNLTKLRHLPKLQRVGRILLAGIEISSSTLDIVLDYTDICSDEAFCPKLKQYNFYLQMALLGGEGMSTLYKGLMESSRKSAKEAYEESRNALIAKHGEDSDEIKALDEHFEIIRHGAKWDNLLSRLDELDLQNLKNKLNELDETTRLKFADNFEEAADEVLRNIGNDSELLDLWKKYSDEFKGTRYITEVSAFKTCQSVLDNHPDGYLGNLVKKVMDVRKPTGSEQVVVGVTHPSFEGKVFMGRNFKNSENALEKIFKTEEAHPLIRKRIKYMDFIRNSVTDNTGKIVDEALANKLLDIDNLDKLSKAGRAGYHGEVRALSDALYELEKDRPVTSSTLLEFDLFIRNSSNKVMQRCPCCFHITHGVRVLGGK